MQGPLEKFHLSSFRRLHHLKALEISFETNAHLSAPGAFLKGFPKVLTTLTKLKFLAISHAGALSALMRSCGNAFFVQCNKRSSLA